MLSHSQGGIRGIKVKNILSNPIWPHRWNFTEKQKNLPKPLQSFSCQGLELAHAQVLGDMVTPWSPLSTAGRTSLRPSQRSCPSCANVSRAQLMDTTTQVGTERQIPLGLQEMKSTPGNTFLRRAGQTVLWCSGPWLSLTLRAAQTHRGMAGPARPV